MKLYYHSWAEIPVDAAKSLDFSCKVLETEFLVAENLYFFLWFIARWCNDHEVICMVLIL